MIAIVGAPAALARPAGYTGVDCDGGLGGGTDVCAMSGSQWVCDLAANGVPGASGGTIYAVWAGTADAYCDNEEYCAFGTDADGNTFFCAKSDTAIRSVWAHGTDNDDFIYFQVSQPAYTLNTWDAGVHVNGVAQAGEGDDTILGSYADSADYTDVLHGDDGDDNIVCDDGDDEATGDEGFDIIYGDAGNDALHGNAHDDELFGGAGVDVLMGGGGADVLDGGPGDDTQLNGEGGDDQICGGTDDDKLHGGSGDDLLWAEDGGVTGTEECTGGTDTDYCQAGCAPTSCSGVPLAVKPSGCP